ncbi:hypothetical protein DVH24_004969 [Malus domestica]|uniref:Uncharacterized protein n=1 Tax=Malus domestica TaxID=3750 RepID=A0A498IG13_MALDO|nr:hypothetical protein DVH24_004969 [Malus domestica]
MHLVMPIVLWGTTCDLGLDWGCWWVGATLRHFNLMRWTCCNPQRCLLGGATLVWVFKSGSGYVWASSWWLHLESLPPVIHCHSVGFEAWRLDLSCVVARLCSLLEGPIIPSDVSFCGSLLELLYFSLS